MEQHVTPQMLSILAHARKEESGCSDPLEGNETVSALFLSHSGTEAQNPRVDQHLSHLLDGVLLGAGRETVFQSPLVLLDPFVDLVGPPAGRCLPAGSCLQPLRVE